MSQTLDPLPRTETEVACPAEPPVVTVIMANYNGERYIEAALQSALRQSLQSIEIIVVDDGSTDRSVSVVAAMAARDPRVRLLTPGANAGPSGARNMCIEHARGRWVAVFDSDDLMHPDRLSRLVEAAERDQADIVTDDLLVFHDDDDKPPSRGLGRADAVAPFWVDTATYVRSNVLFGRTVALGYLKPVIRTEFLTKSEIRYDPSLRLGEDYDFILRLLLCGARMRVYPELTYFYRKHGHSISHRLSRHKLQPLLQASDRNRAQVDPADHAVRDAIDERHASIQRALTFDALVETLKNRNWIAAAQLTWRSPGAASLLTLPVAERLRRFTSLAWLPRGRKAPPAPMNAVRAARKDLSGPRQVCVISRQRVVGSTNGSSVYLLSLCDALRRAGMEVNLVVPSPAVFGRWPVLLMRPEMALFRSITIRGALRFGSVFIATDPRVGFRALAALISKPLDRLGIAPESFKKPAPYAIALPLDQADAIFLARHARGNADAIVADYAFLTEGIPYVLRPDAPSAVVMHDLFSSRGAQFDRIGETDSVALITEAAEMAMLAGAGAVVAIQPEEAQLVRAGLPKKRVILAPMAVETVHDAQPGENGRILFVGSKTAPNVIGLRWFLEQVWPKVRASAPEAELTVAGTVSSAVAPGPGVRLLGRVSSLDAYYTQAAVVISPLLVGSGLKIKLVEALGHGKAIVATTATVQGFEDLAREAVAIADDPGAFAAAIMALLHDRNLRVTRGTSALSAAVTRFSPEACYSDFVAYVAGATVPENRSRTSISD